MGFQSPALEYGALAPMLIIFGAAIIGVIVEAFLSAKVRAPIQLAISLGAVVLSLSQVWRLRGSATTTAGNESLPDLNRREIAAIAPVIALIVALGFYPKPALEIINPAAQVTITKAGYSDPQPLVGGDK